MGSWKYSGICVRLQTPEAENYASDNGSLDPSRENPKHGRAMAGVCYAFSWANRPVFRWILTIYAGAQRRPRYPPFQRLSLPLGCVLERFRKLVSVVLLSGTIAGLLLFVVQHFTVFPLIEKAEVYESAAEKHMSEMHHEDEGWHPADGVERTGFTILSTVLAAIGFAALLFGTAAITPVSLDWRRGALWGLAAFICVDLAPAWGLPPQPPGVAVADLYARQIWWVATVISTAVALWLLLDRRKPLPVRLMGLLVFAAPHVIGAPVAMGENSVPPELIHRFAVLSILTTGVFWIALGSIGGLFYRRSGYAEPQ
jgi:cobalt transporter subunit CbtA